MVLPANTTDLSSTPGLKTTPDVVLLRSENGALREENTTLKNRIQWFEKQLFGRKSEKRVLDNPQQQHFDDVLGEPESNSTPPEDKVTVTYQRGTAKKQRREDDVNDTGLRFTDEVPVEVIDIVPAELQGSDADDYEIIDTKVTHRLGQRPASYVVLRYERPVLKRKDTQQLITTAAADNVLDNSLADVSLLSGLLVDKFLYHLPLYRQHQRIQQAGITLSRATLTNLSKRAISLLRPIVAAQLGHVLQSKVLAMDETPIKASRQGKGKSKDGKSKMKQGWFWPVYGEDDEVVFTYSPSRGCQHIEDTLRKDFTGTLITDGYEAYARYAEKQQGMTHAQCRVHSRRKFVDAEAHEPRAVERALAIIGKLYEIEQHIKDKRLQGEKKRQRRLTHSKPVVGTFFDWCEQQLHRSELTPKHPLRQAVNYVLSRQTALRVFLEDPDVPLDTNHLERALRPIPMGRKNWMFCWTELGAEHVGIIQSLIVTCKLHDINPYTYLIDVLQRISHHPASQVEELTPRVWKTLFADNPMRSPLERTDNNVWE